MYFESKVSFSPSLPNRQLFLLRERAAGCFIDKAARHDPPSEDDVGLNMLKRLVHSLRRPEREIPKEKKKTVWRSAQRRSGAL